MIVLVGATVAFVVSLLVVFVIERRASSLGLIDRPNHRSSHVVPRPRGGGIGILCGVAAGLAVVVAAGPSLDGGVWVVLAASLAVAAIGLYDDVSPVAPIPRLGVQAVAAGLVVWACGGFSHVPLPAPFDVALGRLGPVLAIVWIVGVTNFFNFMDGADGLAAGQASITLAALAWVLWPLPLSTVALLAVVSTAAFLLRNWAPARIFLGDVGSGWMGFVLAAVPFAGPRGWREDLVLLVATSLALFLVDPAITLIGRWRRGERLTASHREHAYQRLFDPLASHARVVAALLVASVILTCVAVLVYSRPVLGWGSVVAAGVACVIEWRVAAARGRRAVIAAGDSDDLPTQR